MEILLDKQACRKEDGIGLFGKRTDMRHSIFLLIHDIIAQKGCLSVLEKLLKPLSRTGSEATAVRETMTDLSMAITTE